MADLRHHLAERCKALRSVDALLKSLGLREISNDGGEVKLPLNPGNGKGNVRWKSLPVFAKGTDFRVVADSPGHTRFNVPVHGLMMLPAATGRHDHIQVPAQNLLPGIAENLFRCFVEKEDFLVPVYGDKGFIGVFNGSLQDSKFINVMIPVCHHRFQDPQRGEEILRGGKASLPSPEESVE